MICISTISATSRGTGGVLAPLVAFLLVSILWFLAVVIIRRSRRESDVALRKLASELTPSDPKVRNLLATAAKPERRRTSRTTVVPTIAAFAGCSSSTP